MRLTSYEVLDLLVSEILNREPSSGATRVLAIDGPSGAGKTQLAEQLRAHAPEMRTSVLHVDDLYPGWHGLEAAVPMVRSILSSVAIGEVGSAPTWDWKTGTLGPYLRVEPTKFLIVEGVTAGARALAPFISVLVWIDGPDNVRRERALARDGQTYAPWWDTWADQERRHFTREQTAARADIVLTVDSARTDVHPV